MRWLLLTIACVACSRGDPRSDVSDATLVAYVELLERAAAIADRPVDCADGRDALLALAPVIRAYRGDDRAASLAADATLHRRLLEAERRVEDRCDACPDLDVVYRELFR